jgi:hypothetical protein
MNPRWTRLATFAAVALILTALAHPTALSQQTRTSSGSGSIGGRVEIVETNLRAPLRRATVTLSVESGALTARSPGPRTTATDADGLFHFDGLPVGNYRLSVEKAGFLCEASGIQPVANAAQVVVNFVAVRAGALEGRLIEDTGKPIADLAVMVERLADTNSQTAAKSYSAKTDDLGRFRVHTLPAGRYRVSATPPSPSSGARLYYPGTEKIEEAGVLAIAAGQSADNLTFVVATGSVPAIAAEAMATQELQALSAPARGGTWAQISGRVTRTDVGQPIANAAVKLSSSGGVLLRTAWTDGAGEYSLSRVIPGTYQLSVSADGYARAPGSDDRITVADGARLKRELRLTPLTSIEGRVLDEFGEPAPGVFLRVSPQTAVVSPMESRPASTMTGLTDDRGWFRVSGLPGGNYNLIALPEPFARSGPATFPITSVPLQLVAGNDVHGVSLVLQTAPTTVISGTIVDAAGRRVPKANVTLSPIFDGQSKGIFRASANADANGNFVYPHVPPGTYLVEGRGPEPFELGSLTITTPSEPFVLALKPLPTARGRIVFDGGPPPEIKPQLRELVLRSLIRVQSIGTAEEPIRFTRYGVVESDWTFLIRGLSSAGLIRTDEEALNWTLARVVMNGRDITDVPYDFQSGDVDNIEVVLTRRVGGITGTVQDGDKPADPVAVVVFGAEGDSWPYLSRTLRAVQPQAGVFSVSGLLPGRYFAVAVRPGVPRSGEEALRALRSLATPIVVSEGADTTIKLSIVK